MDWTEFVLREGDRVEAWGRLVRTQGGTFFEPPLPVPLVWPPQVSAPSALAVPVVGADVHDVESRTEDRDIVQGFATLSGRWIEASIHVDGQTPRRLHGPRPTPEWSEPPCPAPDGGWPHGARDANLGVDLSEVRDSGAAVALTMFRPSRTQVVLVAAAADPEAVEASLRARLGARLCLVPSRCSRAQLDAARDELVRRMDPDLIWSVGESSDGQGQPVVTVELARMRTDLAAWLAEQPDGLVHVEVWLAPTRDG